MKILFDLSTFERITSISRPLKGKSIISIPKEYTIIDIETTGLDPSFNSIIEVGAIKVRNNIIVDKFESLIKPPVLYNNGKDYYIDTFIENLTGITNEMLENAPTLNDVLQNYKTFLENDILIAHNAHFDINFLYDNFNDVLEYPLINDFIDTLRLARKLLPELNHHRLQDLTTFFSINNKQHRALSDCESLFAVYNFLKDVIDKKFTNEQALIDEFTKKYRPAQKLNKALLNTSNTEFDTTHIFYNKLCVFTGTLHNMTRNEAMKFIISVGGKVADGVNKDTNFLIVGSFDYIASVKDKSQKIIKAENCKLKGQDIEILSENVFFDIMMNSK